MSVRTESVSMVNAFESESRPFVGLGETWSWVNTSSKVPRLTMVVDAVLVAIGAL